MQPQTHHRVVSSATSQHSPSLVTWADCSLGLSPYRRRPFRPIPDRGPPWTWANKRVRVRVGFRLELGWELVPYLTMDRHEPVERGRRGEGNEDVCLLRWNVCWERVCWLKGSNKHDHYLRGVQSNLQRHLPFYSPHVLCLGVSVAFRCHLLGDGKHTHVLACARTRRDILVDKAGVREREKR